MQVSIIGSNRSFLPARNHFFQSVQLYPNHPVSRSVSWSLRREHQQASKKVNSFLSECARRNFHDPQTYIFSATEQRLGSNGLPSRAPSSKKGWDCRDFDGLSVVAVGMLNRSRDDDPRHGEQIRGDGFKASRATNSDAIPSSVAASNHQCLPSDHNQPSICDMPISSFSVWLTCMFGSQQVAILNRHVEPESSVMFKQCYGSVWDILDLHG